MDSLATRPASAFAGQRDVPFRAAHAPVDAGWLVTFLPGGYVVEWGLVSLKPRLRRIRLSH